MEGTYFQINIYKFERVQKYVYLGSLITGPRKLTENK